MVYLKFFEADSQIDAILVSTELAILLFSRGVAWRELDLFTLGFTQTRRNWQYWHQCVLHESEKISNKILPPVRIELGVFQFDTYLLC